ncbi:hypothetical protein GJ744_001548 [Endocarpon pusillum]|uniref:RING-type domain-containing protein n=1 Tax=Endocarpon pusillum TaxID=364733 RepID=A0A8H7AD87_9EURO|nr:hypothetical protein GJ744_001548 [Endocarpon pusillum]
MTSWATFQELPHFHIDPPATVEWPDSEQDNSYSSEQPWRLRKYDPYNNSIGFDEDIVAKLEQLHVPKGILTTTAAYGQLIRFTHIRQTRFQGPPNRDGTNLNVVLTKDPKDGRVIEVNGSESLQYMWRCYAAVLRAIHREGQIKPGVGGTWVYQPWNELAHMMQTYPQELERLENERVGRPPFENTMTSGFEWLITFGEHLNEMMRCLQAIINWAQEVGEDPREYVHEAFSRFPATVQLLVVLKSREIAFEEAIGNEHFEDVLIDKRVWVMAPRDFYDFGLDWRIPTRKWFTFLNGTVKPQLARFRRQLRDRFDYRLLVDWGYGRLWKKLYILFKPESQDEKDTIKQFSRFATGHSKLAFNLFAIHPLDIEEVKPDPCSICLCDFEHDDLVMETHCNHHFHPACLFSYWDDEHRFQNRCPECRTSQGILRDKVNFEAERRDVCYESNHELSRLEHAYMVALVERVSGNIAFHDAPPLMEMWCRSRVERLLKGERERKKLNVKGWNDLS